MTPSESRLEGDLPVTDAATAAASIDTDATLLVSGFGSVGYPKLVPLALSADDRDLSLTIVSGGSVGDEIDVELVEAGAVARRFPYQARAPAREAVNERDIEFHDRNISTLSDEVRYGNLVDPDVAVVEALAVGEDWLVPSLSIGHTPEYVQAADRLIVEVNSELPLSASELHDVYLRRDPPNREPIPLTHAGERIGDPYITFDPEKLDAVVETDRPGSPYSFREPTGDDRAIASHLATFVETEVRRSPVFENTLHIQFGVGSLGNALMSEFESAELGGRDVVYFGEVIQDGLLDLLDSGLLQAASATSLALSKSGQQRLLDGIETYAEQIVLRPANLSNSPELINRFGVMGVNSALEVDIYGHANSTHVDGRHAINGIGGSGDFNRNALVSVTALPSTTANGEISCIVPLVAHTDHTEHDIDVVITEQGVADLRGKSPSERAQLLIENCAHPEYRSDLRSYYERASERGGHIPHDLPSAFTWNE